MADHEQRNIGTMKPEEEEDDGEEEESIPRPQLDDDVTLLRSAAMNVVIEKLARSSSREIHEIFDQMKQQQQQHGGTTVVDDSSSSSATGPYADPALRRAMRILDYTDAAVMEQRDDEDDDPEAPEDLFPDEVDGKLYPEAPNDDDVYDNERIVRNNNLTTKDDLVQRCLDRAVAIMGPLTSYTGSQPQQALSYGSNPAITATALAHLLWSYIVRPGVDTVIDATAGNGQDSVQLAKLLLLLPHSPHQPEGPDDIATTTTTTNTAKLICMDVQEIACANTRAALSDTLTPAQLQRHVEVIHGSHAQLPAMIHPDNGIGLIVYNLGFLPGSDKVIATQVESTIESLAQASTMVRIGGMISVMTYPRSNRVEDAAVAAFLAQLAAQTKRFRINEHRQLARPNAPILYTATRIK
jgi:Putative rRNA methylase